MVPRKPNVPTEYIHGPKPTLVDKAMITVGFIVLSLLFLLATQALAAERVPVVDVVIVPGQSAIIICDGMLAEPVEIDALTFMVDCIR